MTAHTALLFFQHLIVLLFATSCSLQKPPLGYHKEFGTCLGASEARYFPHRRPHLARSGLNVEWSAQSFESDKPKKTLICVAGGICVSRILIFFLFIFFFLAPPSSFLMEFKAAPSETLFGGHKSALWSVRPQIKAELMHLHSQQEVYERRTQADSTFPV